MEQKQIDELEDSYTGEEFIDEEDLSTLQAEVKPEVKPKRGRPPKKTAKADVAKQAEEIKAKVAEEVKITPVKEEVKPEQSKVEPASPSEPITTYDPWDDEDEPVSGGSFWKLLTGVLVILLVISVFTSGFNFSGGNELTGASTVSLSEAESAALNYVNNNLLQPPFIAELTNSVDLGNLYQVTMSVAGQEIDSYITKDGKLFFPQGFDTSLSLVDEFSPADDVVIKEEVVEETVDLVESEVQLEEVQDEVVEELAEEEVAEPVEPIDPVEPEVEPVLSDGETKEFNLAAKKWLFNPNTISVNQGDLVRLMITSTDLVFNFAVPDYGVEEEVSGSNVVEFTATEKGTFEFACSSCEDWRGMTGTLIVE